MTGETALSRRRCSCSETAGSESEEYHSAESSSAKTQNSCAEDAALCDPRSPELNGFAKDSVGRFTASPSEKPRQRGFKEDGGGLFISSPSYRGETADGSPLASCTNPTKALHAGVGVLPSSSMARPLLELVLPPGSMQRSQGVCTTHRLIPVPSAPAHSPIDAADRLLLEFKGPGSLDCYYPQSPRSGECGQHHRSTVLERQYSADGSLTGSDCLSQSSLQPSSGEFDSTPDPFAVISLPNAKGTGIGATSVEAISPDDMTQTRCLEKRNRKTRNEASGESRRWNCQADRSMEGISDAVEHHRRHRSAARRLADRVAVPGPNHCEMSRQPVAVKDTAESSCPGRRAGSPVGEQIAASSLQRSTSMQIENHSSLPESPGTVYGGMDGVKDIADAQLQHTSSHCVDIGGPMSQKAFCAARGNVTGVKLPIIEQSNHIGPWKPQRQNSTHSSAGSPHKSPVVLLDSASIAEMNTEEFAGATPVQDIAKGPNETLSRSQRVSDSHASSAKHSALVRNLGECEVDPSKTPNEIPEGPLQVEEVESGRQGGQDGRDVVWEIPIPEEERPEALERNSGDSTGGPFYRTSGFSKESRSLSCGALELFLSDTNDTEDGRNPAAICEDTIRHCANMKRLSTSTPPPTQANPPTNLGHGLLPVSTLRRLREGAERWPAAGPSEGGFQPRSRGTRKDKRFPGSSSIPRPSKHRNSISGAMSRRDRQEQPHLVIRGAARSISGFCLDVTTESNAWEESDDEGPRDPPNCSIGQLEDIEHGGGSRHAAYSYSFVAAPPGPEATRPLSVPVDEASGDNRPGTGEEGTDVNPSGGDGSPIVWWETRRPSTAPGLQSPVPLPPGERYAENLLARRGPPSSWDSDFRSAAERARNSRTSFDLYTDDDLADSVNRRPQRRRGGPTSCELETNPNLKTMNGLLQGKPTPVVSRMVNHVRRRSLDILRRLCLGGNEREA